MSLNTPLEVKLPALLTSEMCFNLSLLNPLNVLLEKYGEMGRQSPGDWSITLDNVAHIIAARKAAEWASEQEGFGLSPEGIKEMQGIGKSFEDPEIKINIDE